jgi:ankyrin repeat protein
MSIKSVSRSNVSSIEGSQPDLQSAIDSDRFEEALTLLRTSDRIDRPLPNGHMPFHYAIRRGKFELVKALVKEGKIDLKAKDSQGLSAVDHAMITNDLKMIELILGQVMEQELGAALSGQMNWKELHSALSLNFLQKAQVQGLARDIKEFGSSKGRFWFVAARGIQKAAREGNLENVQKYFNPKNPDPYDAYGLTPLHYAALSGKMEVAKWLIEKGNAETVISTREGELSLLHLASIGGNAELVSYLIKTRGWNPNVTDRQGRTPLHFAMALEDFSAAKVLIQNGADPTVKTSGNLHSPIQIAYFLAKERSKERDPLDVNFNEWLMFGGILLSWAARIVGASEESAFVPFMATVIGAFLNTFRNLESSPLAGAAYVTGTLACLNIHRNDLPLKGLPWFYGITWKGNSIPRAYLGLTAGMTVTTAYQIAISSIKRLANLWKNRTLEPFRPIRNAIIHSVITAQAAYLTTNILARLYEHNKIFNAWDRYMDVEKGSFQDPTGGLPEMASRKKAHIEIFWERYQQGKYNDLADRLQSQYSIDRSVSSICNGKSEKECILEGNNEPKFSAISCLPQSDSCEIRDQGAAPRLIPKKDVRAKAAAILQLKEGYTNPDVKKSYYALRKKYSPDKVLSLDYSQKKEANELCSNLELAHQLLV